MISKLSIAVAFFGFSSVAFANDETATTAETAPVEVEAQAEIAVKAPAKPEAKKKTAFEDDDEEDFTIELGGEAQKSAIVDEVLDYELTDTTTRPGAPVRVVEEDNGDEPEIDAKLAEEASEVEWSFDVDGDEEE